MTPTACLTTYCCGAPFRRLDSGVTRYPLGAPRFGTVPTVDVEEPETQRTSSQAYELFILVLTVLSLVVMVAIMLPLNESVIDVLQFYDNLIALIFLGDFAMRMRRASPTSSYFIGERGWLDLLGSIPSFGNFFPYTALFRLARISRLARIMRVMRGKQRKEFVSDVLANRSKYALFVTVLTTMIVLCTATVVVLQFESTSIDATISNGWDAFWFSVVTITTVGYGDFTPVTVMGRLAAMAIMIAGVGLIGALASILASVLVGGADDEADTESVDAPSASEMQAQLAQISSELAEIRSLLERRGNP